MGSGFRWNIDLAEKAWHIWDRLKGWVDGLMCAHYINSCRETVEENINLENVNPDENKALWDAIQCQQQGRTDCSSAGWNNVHRSGILDNENCKKAAECGLDLLKLGVGTVSDCIEQPLVGDEKSGVQLKWCH